MSSQRKSDRIFLLLTGLLVFVGLIIFTSASMGLLAKDGPTYSSIILNQLIFGLALGGLALFGASRIPYPFWKKLALPIFITAAILNLLIFIPQIGLEYGGARRWIGIFGLSFQPSETLKIAFVIFFSAWLTAAKSGIETFKRGALPLLILFLITGGLLLLQKDTDTYAVVIVAGLAMFISAGGKWRHAGLIILIALTAFATVVALRPYVLGRVLTFLDPSRDPLGAGYQIQQSLIAVGSGQIFGRGFGQSIQKFNYLPEPMGDSIFAVAAEEFGFLGATILILLFVFYALRGMRIAGRAPDTFSKSLTTGIVALVIGQSFLNISAMLGVLPLSGTPLLFVSQGGTALLFVLFESGIILNISKFSRLKSA